MSGVALHCFVVPAYAGIQCLCHGIRSLGKERETLGPGVRRDDE